MPKIQKLESRIRKQGKTDIELSNPYGDKLHTSLAALKALMLNFFATIVKKQEPH